MKDAFALPLKEFFARYDQATEIENWKQGGDPEIGEALKKILKNAKRTR